MTEESLARDLRGLGLRAGAVVLVHVSLRAVAGPRSTVLGGPVAVLDALDAVLGPQGTLVMPAFSADWSEPARWREPAAPVDWWPLVREALPAWRADATPTFRIGATPEIFRKLRGVRRSAHPQASFCARGAAAARVCEPHAPEAALGEESPLARLYALDADVVFLGTGWSTCTAFHLGEVRGRRPVARVDQGAPLLDAAGRRVWVTWREPDHDARDFDALGRAFEAAHGDRIATGRVGRAPGRRFPLRAAVDFAADWTDRYR